MKCLICFRNATYLNHPNGPICSRCAAGVKQFDYKPKLISRARKFLVRGLREQKMGDWHPDNPKPTKGVRIVKRYSESTRQAMIRQLKAEQRADKRDKKFRTER